MKQFLTEARLGAPASSRIPISALGIGESLELRGERRRCRLRVLTENLNYTYGKLKISYAHRDSNKSLNSINLGNANLWRRFS